ncbi:hypothetical protein HMPREF1989_02243 [Porphyromonas gingivalis F0566]|nr:hypothetical protein HMPREF1989_02243 [Porphyromonas gingivalis F0566]
MVAQKIPSNIAIARYPFFNKSSTFVSLAQENFFRERNPSISGEKT